MTLNYYRNHYFLPLFIVMTAKAQLIYYFCYDQLDDLSLYLRVIDDIEASSFLSYL